MLCVINEFWLKCAKTWSKAPNSSPHCQSQCYHTAGQFRLCAMYRYVYWKSRPSITRKTIWLAGCHNDTCNAYSCHRQRRQHPGTWNPELGASDFRWVEPSWAVVCVSVWNNNMSDSLGILPSDVPHRQTDSRLIDELTRQTARGSLRSQISLLLCFVVFRKMTPVVGF